MTIETTHVDEKPLRVKGDTPVASLAGCIATIIRSKGQCEVQAIGAAAVNQAIKGIAIARGYVAPQGHDLIVLPAFLDIQIAAGELTAIRFLVECR